MVEQVFSYYGPFSKYLWEIWNMESLGLNYTILSLVCRNSKYNFFVTLKILWKVISMLLSLNGYQSVKPFSVTVYLLMSVKPGRQAGQWFLTSNL